MDGINERFFRITDSLGLTNKKIVEMAEGISKQSISNAKGGRNTVPIKLMQALSKQYNVDINYIITGEGEPFIKANVSNVEAVGAYISDNLVRVPYVPVSATASFIDSLYDVNYEMDTYSLVPEKDELLDEKYMVFQVNGDSMEPTIPDGSKILAHKIDESQWENADGVVVVVYGKVLTVKRIKKNALYLDNLLVLKADNHKHGEMDVERREIRGMWKVKRIVSLNIV